MFRDPNALTEKFHTWRDCLKSEMHGCFRFQYVLNGAYLNQIGLCNSFYELPEIFFFPNQVIFWATESLIMTRMTHIELYMKFMSPGEREGNYGRRESYSTCWTRHGGHFTAVCSDHRLAGGRKWDDWESVPAARLAGGRAGMRDETGWSHSQLFLIRGEPGSF